jgi:glucuronosyltransferase
LKVFITHGGLLSIQESVYHGVPVIGIPIIGDQRMNVNAAVSAGYGYFLDLQLLEYDKLILEAINTVITDSK